VSSSPESEILEVLTSFQDGYTKRDLSLVKAYVEEHFAEDVLVIGTGPDEWCYGLEEVEKLVEGDWKEWGDLELTIDRAVIRVRESWSWLVVPGSLTQSVDSYPIRVSAGLSKIEGLWKFHQMTFSYPHPRRRIEPPRLAI
jgi:hypothetical protein